MKPRPHAARRLAQTQPRADAGEALEQAHDGRRPAIRHKDDGRQENGRRGLLHQPGRGNDGQRRPQEQEQGVAPG